MYILGQQTDIGLREKLVYAAQEVDYYRVFLHSHKQQTKSVPQLSSFPLLTRQSVQKEHSRFLNNRYQRYPDIDYLLIKRSFGSAGVPLEIYWDSRDNKRSEERMWAIRKERYGVNVNDKRCVFRTAEYEGNKILDYMPIRLSWNEKTLSFLISNQSQEQLQEYMDAMLEFDPVWLQLPPSVAQLMAEIVTTSGKPTPPSLHYIELYGETYDEQTEELIQNVFHARTANVYSTAAAGTVAVSCPYGHLHVISENVLVEIMRDGKQVLDEEEILLLLL